MARILIADSDPDSHAELTALLRLRSHRVQSTADGSRALAAVREGEADLVLCDLQVPGIDGLALVRLLKQERPDVPVLLLAAFSSLEDAVLAMREGAADFIGKPFNPDQVVVAIERALEKASLQQENANLREALDDRIRLENLVGTDPRMQAIFKTIKAVAETRTTVLITGESGTGKTLLARSLHALSQRSKGPFVEVNCGALPESLLESELFGHVRGAFTGATRDRAGKFEAANGGTIFLDEIGTSSPAFQVKLLRVLQDRVIERVGDTQSLTVDVRLVLATNLDLEKAVREGRFREDLYYRIHVVALEMPPLRERPGDIPFLAEHFLRRFGADHAKSLRGFTPAAMQALTAAPWPGNVRQLENVVERAVVLSTGSHVDVVDLPPAILPRSPAGPSSVLVAGSPILPLKHALEGPEKLFIEQALQHCSGNRERAAELLGINRSTLFAKLRKYGIR
jgi:DNA-binding NtrC family response regulator